MYNPNDLRELTSEIFYTRRDIRPNDEVVRYYCENGYGLSVACHEHSYGGKEGLYEIALLKGDQLHYDDHEWQDVRGWLTKAEVWTWLRIVSEYWRREGTKANSNPKWYNFFEMPINPEEISEKPSELGWHTFSGMKV